MFLFSNYAYGQLDDALFKAISIANKSLQIRLDPPHGPLNVVLGKIIKEVPAGTELNITGKRSYPGVKSPSVWYRVEFPSSPEKGMQIEIGWVYGGEEGATKPIIQIRN